MPRTILRDDQWEWILPGKASDCRVYVRYNRWSHKGHWEAIFMALSQDPD